MTGDVTALASGGCHIFSGCGFPAPGLQDFEWKPLFSIGSFDFTKPMLLAVVVSSLNGTTAFSTRTLGFVAIGCILVWSATQVITTMKLKMLYVEPETSGR